MSQAEIENQPQVFGHPAGLYTLFFAEMWERFSYYGMRALLVFYMIKGFLGYGDTQAYTVYGAYTALVYMTPFIGGLLADKILGKRLAVVLGGLLMAGGHLLMTREDELSFFFALALIIAGNGFFKPNISTIVGSLYPQGDRRRDDGFNIFYTGINLGAAISPLLCGYVGETYGWHLGFGLATAGMLVGLAVFVMPTLVTQLLIMAAAIASAIGLFVFRPDNIYAISINVFVAICLMIAAVVAWVALTRGGLPKWAGQRPEGMDSRHDWKIYLGTLISIPVFAMLVSGFSPLLSAPEEKVKTKQDLMDERVEFLTKLNVEEETIAKIKAAGISVEPKSRAKPYQLISADRIARFKNQVDSAAVKKFVAQSLSLPSDEFKDGTDFSTLKMTPEQSDQLLEKLATQFEASFPSNPEKRQKIKSIDDAISVMNASRATPVGEIGGIFLEEVSKPAGLVLALLGFLALGYLVIETFKLSKIPRERMIAALILIFFQMLFFAFFEQAGVSINNFTDRNIDRVNESEVVTEEMVGKKVVIEPTQAQLGFEYNDKGDKFTNDDLNKLRKIIQEVDDVDKISVDWEIRESNKGMGIATRLDELPASIFQSFNAIFILIFALVFNWIWSTLRKYNLDPSAPVKFGLGLVQLGLGFGALWLGAQNCSDVGMVAIRWLALGYLLHTTGELCLSPVGLSTMTKLSPKALVSTLMGAWFLATAFSQYLAAIISQFTSVEGGGGGASSSAPLETVDVYGGVFGSVGIIAMVCGGVCILISPLLKYWMHEGVDIDDDGKPIVDKSNNKTDAP